MSPLLVAVLIPARALCTLVLPSPSLFRRGWPPPGLSPPCVRALGTCDTGGRAQQARVPDNWQHTATPRNTPRRQPIPLPAPNIIKQDPVVFHKSSVGLNEGGQRLSATPLTSPTEPSPGLDIFPWMENIPERLVQRLRWTQGTSPKVPSSGPIIVLLYAGKEDPTSLDSCLHANYPHLSSMVVAVDILR